MKKPAAFTLIELLLALSIIIVLTVISIPAADVMIRSSNVDGAAYIVKNALMNARGVAIAQNTESSCWVAAGDVYETGTILCNLPSSSEAYESIVDDASATPIGTWTVASGVTDAHNDSLRYAAVDGDGSEYVEFSFTIENGSGNLDVYAWWAARTNRSTAVQFKIEKQDKSGWNTVPKDQTQNGEQWVKLGTFPFNSGTYHVRVTDEGSRSDKYAVADAIKVSGTISPPQLDWSKQFAVGAADWPVNKWKDCYATIQNLGSTTNYTTVRAKLASTEKDNVTATANWSTSLVSGSPFLICTANPAAPGRQPLVLGSGATGSMRWDPLPRGMMIHTKFINDNGTDSSKDALPITFKPTGRVVTTQSYLTLKLYAYDPDDPKQASDRSRWRFIRIYPNTGRSFIAKTVAELPD